jgi:branched-chain amino acid transport system substrate-binding protein
MSSVGKLVGIAIIAIIIIIGAGYVIGGSDEGNNESSDTPIQESSELVGEVNIGLILPLSGDLATHGEENWEGSKLGVVDFNKHLEEIDAGWTLKMTSEDSATSPVIALEKLSALNAKGIGIVVGPETSSNIRNIKGYSDSNNMLLVSCCSSAPALAIPNDSVFRLVPDDSNQGTAISKLKCSFN